MELYIGDRALSIYNNLNHYLDTLLSDNIIEVLDGDPDNDSRPDPIRGTHTRKINYARKIRGEPRFAQIFLCFNEATSHRSTSLYIVHHCIDRPGDDCVYFPLNDYLVQQYPESAFQMWMFTTLDIPENYTFRPDNRNHDFLTDLRGVLLPNGI
jgi:hypothetical protein